MDTAQFQTQFERLLGRSAWRNKLDQFFSDMLWNKIKNYQAKPFELAVDQILGQHNCPTVDQIKNSVGEFARTTGTASRIPEIPCEWCDHFGLLVMSGKGTRPFHCGKCSNGNLQREMAANRGMLLDPVRSGWLNGMRPLGRSMTQRYESALARADYRAASAGEHRG
jgi:hypothetical protein